MRFLFLCKSVLSFCEVNFGEDFVNQVIRITSRCQACSKVFNVFLKHFFRRVCPQKPKSFSFNEAFFDACSEAITWKRQHVTLIGFRKNQFYFTLGYRNFFVAVNRINRYSVETLVASCSNHCSYFSLCTGSSKCFCFAPTSPPLLSFYCFRLFDQSPSGCFER